MPSKQSGLSRIREERGLRRERVAADAGITVQHLRNLEKGKHEPSLGLARRLAAALGATIDQLFPERAA